MTSLAPGAVFTVVPRRLAQQQLRGRGLAIASRSVVPPHRASLATARAQGPPTPRSTERLPEGRGRPSSVVCKSGNHVVTATADAAAPQADPAKNLCAQLRTCCPRAAKKKI